MSSREDEVSLRQKKRRRPETSDVIVDEILKSTTSKAEIQSNSETKSKESLAKDDSPASSRETLEINDSDAMEITSGNDTIATSSKKQSDIKGDLPKERTGGSKGGLSSNAKQLNKSSSSASAGSNDGFSSNNNVSLLRYEALSEKFNKDGLSQQSELYIKNVVKVLRKNLPEDYQENLMMTLIRVCSKMMFEEIEILWWYSKLEAIDWSNRDFSFDVLLFLSALQVKEEMTDEFKTFEAVLDSILGNLVEKYTEFTSRMAHRRPQMQPKDLYLKFKLLSTPPDTIDYNASVRDLVQERKSQKKPKQEGQISSNGRILSSSNSLPIHIQTGQTVGAGGMSAQGNRVSPSNLQMSQAAAAAAAANIYASQSAAAAAAANSHRAKFKRMKTDSDVPRLYSNLPTSITPTATANPAITSNAHALFSMPMAGTLPTAGVGVASMWPDLNKWQAAVAANNLAAAGMNMAATSGTPGALSAAEIKNLNDLIALGRITPEQAQVLMSKLATGEVSSTMGSQTAVNYPVIDMRQTILNRAKATDTAAAVGNTNQTINTTKATAASTTNPSEETASKTTVTTSTTATAASSGGGGPINGAQTVNNSSKPRVVHPEVVQGTDTTNSGTTSKASTTGTPSSTNTTAPMTRTTTRRLTSSMSADNVTARVTNPEESSGSANGAGGRGSSIDSLINMIINNESYSEKGEGNEKDNINAKELLDEIFDGDQGNSHHASSSGHIATSSAHTSAGNSAGQKTGTVVGKSAALVNTAALNAQEAKLRAAALNNSAMLQNLSYLQNSINQGTAAAVAAAKGSGIVMPQDGNLEKLFSVIGNSRALAEGLQANGGLGTNEAAQLAVQQLRLQQQMQNQRVLAAGAAGASGRNGGFARRSRTLPAGSIENLLGQVTAPATTGQQISGASVEGDDKSKNKSGTNAGQNIGNFMSLIEAIDKVEKTEGDETTSTTVATSSMTNTSTAATTTTTAANTTTTESAVTEKK